MSDRLFAIVAAGVITDIVLAPSVEVLSHAAVDITGAEPMPCVGWNFDGTDFSSPPPFSRAEAAVKRDAISRVNYLAGECRSKYLTVVPGQSETYLLKADELRAYDAAVAAEEAIDANDYPILATEALTTGATFEATVELVRATRAAWLQLAAVVEGMRRGAIVAIEQATTEAAVLTAIPPSEIWP